MSSSLWDKTSSIKGIISKLYSYAAGATESLNMLYVSFLIFIVLLFFAYIRLYAKAEAARSGKIFTLSSGRLILLSLLFAYTIFPVRWAQATWQRSLQSFPAFTFIDSAVGLLLLAGTTFCALYCFEKIPERLVTLVEKATERFFEVSEPFFIVTALGICFLITGTIAYAVLGGIPHVEDSIAQLFQAKIFMMGKLYAPLPPLKEFFDYEMIINDTKWYSQYPPGHPVALMIGLYLGVPWLVGPIEGTLSLFVFYLIVKSLYHDRRIVYLSCCMLLFSPFFLFMSSGHMNHNTGLLFILLFLFCYLRMYSSGHWLYFMCSGLALGCAVNSRTLTATVFSAFFLCNLVYSTFKSREIEFKKLLIFIASTTVLIGVLLYYNYLTNDSPLKSGYQQNFDTLGFFGKSQFGPAHTFKGALVNTANNLIALNQYLFAWPLPSLIFIFIFFALPIKKSRWEYFFLIGCFEVMACFFAYFYQDLCYGPRFYYLLMPFMIMFTVRGFLELPAWLEKKGYAKRATVSILYLLLALCYLFTFSYSFPRYIKKYSDDYWWVTDKIYRSVKEQGITNALIFIDVWHPRGITEPNFIPYASGFQFNSPDLSDDVIYAMDLKERNRELMKKFPGRNYYFCEIYKPMSGFRFIKLNEN